MSFRRSISNFAKVSLFAISCGVHTRAADIVESATEGRTPTAAAPGSPAGSYGLSGLDTVNLFNGHLNFALPLRVIGGRGESGYSMTLPIERNWTIEHHHDTSTNVDSYLARTNLTPKSHWTSGLGVPLFSPGMVLLRRRTDGVSDCNGSGPTVYNNVRTVAVYIGTDGTEHEMSDRGFGGGFAGLINCTGGFSRRRVFEARDGSAMTFISNDAVLDNHNYTENDSYALAGGWLYLKNGTKYEVVGSQIRSIIDRNGNTTVLVYSGSDLTSVTDPLGRVTTLAHTPTTVTIQFPGAGGLTRTVIVRFDTLGNRLGRDPTTNTPYTAASYSDLWGTYGPGTTIFDPTVIKEVEIPGGKKYQFWYNAYGELAQVSLPTSGIYRYMHTGAGIGGASTTGTPPFKILSYRRLVSKWVYKGLAGGDPLALNDTNLAGKTIYTFVHTTHASGTPEGLFSNTKVTAESQTGTGGVLQKTEHYYWGGADNDSNLGLTPQSFNNPWQGLEYQTKRYNLSGGLLRSVIRTWAQRPCAAGEVCAFATPTEARLIKEQTVLEDTTGAASTRKAMTSAFAYDRYNNRILVSEHDFGPVATDSVITDGTLLRQTETSYATTVTGASYDGIPAAQPVGADFFDSFAETEVTHIRDAVLSRKIFSGATTVAETTFDIDNYSEYGLVGRASPTNQNVKWAAIAFSKRGNTTKSSRRLNALRTSENATYVSVSVQYDVLGNIVTRKDERGKVTTISYAPSSGSDLAGCSSGFANAYSVPAKITNPLNHLTNYVWDCYLGQLARVQERDVIGSQHAATDYEFDDTLDRLTKITTPIGITTIVYDDANLTVTRSQEQASCKIGAGADVLITATTKLDGLGRAIETGSTDEQGAITTRTGYDFFNRVVYASNPFRVGSLTETETGTTTKYDGLARVEEVTGPDGAKTASTFAMNLTTTTDPAAKSTAHTADALGRLVSVTEGTASTSYQYDPLDNLARVDQAGQTRYYHYDSLSRLVCASNPEARGATSGACLNGAVLVTTGVALYTYDEAGNLLTKVNANGSGINYSPAGNGIDNLNRVKRVEYSGLTTPAVDYVFDSCRKGTMCSVANSKATQTMTYNAAGQMIGSGLQVVSAGTMTYSYSYLYDKAGNLETVTYPSGRKSTTCVDAGNRPKKVLSGDKTSAVAYAKDIVHHAAGIPLQVRYGNQVVERRGVNSRLQETARSFGTCLAASCPAGTWTAGDLLRLTNEYAATGTPAVNNGNVLAQEIEMPKTNGQALRLRQTHSYDGRNRLLETEEKTQTESPQVIWKITNGYSESGNRFLNVPATTLSLTFGTPTAEDWFSSTTNRLTKSHGGVALPAGSHDDSGNMLSHPQFGTMTYDAEGRMVSWGQGSTTVTHEFDGLGRKVARIIGGQKTFYVWDGVGMLRAEYEVNGPAAVSGVRYLGTDMLGSARLVTDGAGLVAMRRDYFPYGEEIAASGAMGNRSLAGGYGGSGMKQLFTGQERDGISGLDDFGARFLSGAVGRFTSADLPFADQSPTNPQSWNLYSYGRNNPLSGTDPDGRAWQNTNGSWGWVPDDDCRDLSRRASVAVAARSGITVYGSACADDITTFGANAAESWTNQPATASRNAQLVTSCVVDSPRMGR